MKTLTKIMSSLMIIFMVNFIVSCNTSKNDTIMNVEASDLNVHYIDVGQADCICIEQDGEFMLIDAGNNDDEKTIKSYLDKLGADTFKYVVGTHPHEDHIGSLDYIINNYNVKNLYMPKVTSNTRTFENVVKAAKNKNLDFTVPKVGESFDLGEATCTIVAPNSKKYENLNNYSIVLKVQFGNNSFLFTGDAESISEKEILDKRLDITADVLKIGHHGSHSSTTKEFLDAVNPKYAIISDGKNNDYGHPHRETLEKLNDKSIKTYRTDESGSIVVSSDKKNIKITLSNFDNDTSSDFTEEDIDEVKNSDVWVASEKSKVYHVDKECSNMRAPKKITLEDAKNRKLRPCSKCSNK